MNKSFFRHSGLDPESRKSLRTLDPPVNPSTILRAMSMSNGPRDDVIASKAISRKRRKTLTV